MKGEHELFTIFKIIYEYVKTKHLMSTKNAIDYGKYAKEI